MNKPKCRLIGTNANIFSLIGRASRCLKDNGLWAQAKEMTEKCFAAHSYDEALSIIMQYVDVH